MSIDNFRRVLFTAGEQLIAADFNALQREMYMAIQDMFIPLQITNAISHNNGGPPTDHRDPLMSDKIVDGTLQINDCCFVPFPSAAVVGGNATALQVVLKNPGPIVQVVNQANIANPSESSYSTLLHWVNASEFPITLSPGHATLPRIDLIQVKLELEDANLVTRVTSVAAVQAVRDLELVTADIDTWIGARQFGLNGNNYTIALAADGTGAGSLVQTGIAAVFHFQTGVTTIANFEAAIALSTLFEVTSAGSPGTVFGVGDVLAATPMLGGSDQVIASGSVNKDRRVRATFSVKQGTPAAVTTTTPQYPAPDAGYCGFSAVYIPATFNAAIPFTAFRDIRFPLGGVRVYDVTYHDISGVGWTQDDSARATKTTTNAVWVDVPCPVGGATGRLIGLGVAGSVNAPNTRPWIFLERLTQSSLVPAHTTLADLERTLGDAIATGNFFPSVGAVDLMRATEPTSFNPLGTANGNTGNPIWTDGTMYGPIGRSNFLNYDGELDKLSTFIQSQSTGGTNIIAVRYVIAHGMG